MTKIYCISRLAVAIIFLYHGLVPKIIFGNEQEVLMNDTLMPFVPEKVALNASGILEVLYGILLLAFYKSKALLYPAMAFSALVTIALLVVLPNLFQHAFNPFSINLSVFVLCAINLLSFPEDDHAPKPNDVP